MSNISYDSNINKMIYEEFFYTFEFWKRRNFFHPSILMSHCHNLVSNAYSTINSSPRSSKLTKVYEYSNVCQVGRGKTRRDLYFNGRVYRCFSDDRDRDYEILGVSSVARCRFGTLVLISVVSTSKEFDMEVSRWISHFVSVGNFYLCRRRIRNWIRVVGFYIFIKKILPLSTSVPALYRCTITL